MKHWLLYMGLLLGIGVSVSSCLGDDSERDDAAYCMATVARVGQQAAFRMDGGGVYLVPDMENDIDSLPIGARYYILFSYADTTNHSVGVYPIHLQEFARVLMNQIEILHKDSTDRFGKTPFSRLDYAWFSGSYLNVVLWANYPYQNQESFHLVRIEQEEYAQVTDTVPELTCELRRKTAVGQGYSFRRFMSFQLDTLKSEFPHAKRFKFNVRWTTEDNSTRSFTIEYNPTLLGLTSGLPALRQHMAPFVR